MSNTESLRRRIIPNRRMGLFLTFALIIVIIVASLAWSFRPTSAALVSLGAADPVQFEATLTADEGVIAPPSQSVPLPVVVANGSAHNNPFLDGQGTNLDHATAALIPSNPLDPTSAKVGTSGQVTRLVPGTSDGSTNRGIRLSWQGQYLINQPGDDFVIAEKGTLGSPGYYVVRVKMAGEAEARDSFYRPPRVARNGVTGTVYEGSIPAGAEGADVEYFTAFDLDTDFGVTSTVSNVAYIEIFPLLLTYSIDPATLQADGSGSIGGSPGVTPQASTLDSSGTIEASESNADVAYLWAVQATNLQDFAFIGDFVWQDNNANGLQDAGEPGLEGITVNLLDAAGDPVLEDDGVTPISTQTDATGAYSFTVIADTYIVEFEVPQGYAVTTKDAGGDTIDSEANPDGRTDPVTVASTDLPGIDAGLLPGYIGDRVWNDLNGNGIQETGEPGIPDVTVKLLDSTGAPVDLGSGPVETTTDASGVYFFLVPTDTYRLDFDLSTSLFASADFTQQDQGADDGLNSDVDPATGETANFDAAPLSAPIPAVPPTPDTGTPATLPVANFGYDAGVVRTFDLGNRVWNDLDDDGVFDALDEEGIDGVTVRLFTAVALGTIPANTEIISDVTSGGGLYTLANVPVDPNAGGVDYYVVFEWDPVEYDYSPDDTVGSASPLAANNDNDIDIPSAGVGTGRTVDFNLPATTTTLQRDSIDAALIQPITISGVYWDDIVPNNIINPPLGTNDDPVAGEQVSLYKEDPATGNMNLVVSVNTLAIGAYSFVDDGTDPLTSGTYSVEFNLPAGFAFVQPNETGDPAVDSAVTDSTNGHTDAFAVAPGEDVTNVNAGIFQPFTLEGQVWNDTNADSNFTEVGQSGVTVNLWNADRSAIVETTTTDATGNYSFDVLAGSYTVQVSLPFDFAFSPFNINDQNVINEQGFMAQQTGVAGDTISNLDAGIFQGNTVQGTVWNDLNNDGNIDAGEAGVGSVIVRLMDNSFVLIAPPIETTTDSTGAYTIEVPSAYTNVALEFDLTSTTEYTFGTTLGTVGDNNDVDAYTVDPRARTAAFDATTEPANIEAALVRLNTVNGYVWDDLNGDGIQNNGDTGVAGVTVELLQNGSTVATTQTNVLGEYQFTDILPGDNYAITVTNPVGYLFTLQDQGTDDALDSDVDELSGLFDIGTLNDATAQTGVTVDAGLIRAATIGNRVWDDINGNGIQDSGEVGLQGVEVELYASTDLNNAIAISTTNALGRYLFTVEPGSYVVRFVLPGGSFTGYVLTLPNEGTDDAFDSDATRDGGDPRVGITAAITVESGDDNPTIDAGFFNAATISGVAWLDLDGDGNQAGVDEVGVGGIQVDLFNVADLTTPYTSTTTATDGSYTFQSVPDGGNSYRVRFTTAAYTFSSAASNLNDAPPLLDNKVTLPNVSEGYGDTNTFNVAPGEVLTNVSAGLVPASLGDFVWNDQNGNGVQDLGEPGMISVTVRLYRSDDTLLFERLTGSDGLYGFPTVPAGTYYLEFDLTTSPLLTPGTNYIATTPDATTDELDSDVIFFDVDTRVGRTDMFEVDPATDDTSLDAGFFNGSSIGDRVWHDLNRDGIQQPREPGLDGVTVWLREDGTTTRLITTTTSGGGFYNFGVTQGFYNIEYALPEDFEFSPANVVGTRTPADNFDSDVVNIGGLTGSTVEFPISAGQNITTTDAGMWTTTSIGDFVWVDEDGDGRQDDAEVGLPGVEVELFIEQEDGTIVSTGEVTQTDEFGFYGFSALVPDNYLVEFRPPSGYAFTPPDAITNDNRDSDADVNTGRTPSRFMDSDTENDDLDAGVFLGVTIGDQIWLDENANGLQDEPLSLPDGITVTVNLLDEFGDPLLPARTFIPDATGLYTFTVIEGSYIVEVVPPAQYILTLPNVGGDDTIDSDVDRTTGRTSVINMTLTNPITDIWDAGIYQSASIGDLVWNDLNEDGVFQDGEPGIEGVLVYADVNNNGRFDATDPFDTSDVDGSYTIFGLDTGTYTVTIATGVPAGLGPTSPIPPRYEVTVGQGEAFVDADFGFSASPDLVVQKTASANTVGAGATITYTLGVSNTGLSDSTGVVITETLPVSTTIAPASLTAGWTAVTGQPGTYTFAVGALPQGSDTIVEIGVTVDAIMPVGSTPLTNTAEVTDDGSNGADANLADNIDTAITTVDVAAPPVPTADMTVAKTNGVTNARPGEQLTYQVTVTNTATTVLTQATGVVVTDTLPVNVSYAAGSASNGGTYDEATRILTWNLGTLDSGASVQLTYQVFVAQDAPINTAFTNNVIVTSDLLDPVPGNNSAQDTTTVVEVIPGTANLLFNKTDSGSAVDPGGTIVYTLRYTNTGDIAASGVVITETVPANTTFNATESAAGWTQVGGGSTYVFSVGTVDVGAGDSVVFAVTVNTTLPDGVTQIDNTALIDDDGTSNAPVSGGSASTTINIVTPPETTTIYLPLVLNPGAQEPPPPPEQQPDLIVSDVTLVPNKTNFTAGEEVELVIEITNIGDALAEAVWVDLYLNPSQVPESSFRWNDICRPDSIANPCIGIAWATREVLQPGESFTLVTDPTVSEGDGGYDDDKSRWFDFFESGTTDLYVLVDSWSGSGPVADDGAVEESNEDNNLFHLPNLNVTGSNPALPQEELPEIEPRLAPGS